MSTLPFPNLVQWLFTPFMANPPAAINIIVATVLLGSYTLINQLFAPWVERKVMARMQGRRGPVYVGWRGILQIPADLLKLILKEDTHPVGIDKVGFFFAILVTAVTSILSFAPLPWGSSLVAGNFSIGILYVFAIFSLFPPFMLIGGWSSNSKYSLIGGFRSAGQLIAYEIPMFVSILGVLALVGSFSLVDIVQYQMQNGWFLIWFFPLGLISGILFFVAGVAETERIPFDLPEDESTLVMGPRTEFAAWRYAMLMMVEYLHLFINSLLFIYLFLGGYDPIPLPIGMIPAATAFRMNPWVQFLTLTVKAYLMVVLAAWFRSALARLRIDQLLTLGWKYMLPLALLMLVGYIFWPLGHVLGLY